MTKTVILPFYMTVLFNILFALSNEEFRVTRAAKRQEFRILYEALMATTVHDGMYLLGSLPNVFNGFRKGRKLDRWSTSYPEHCIVQSLLHALSYLDIRQGQHIGILFWHARCLRKKFRYLQLRQFDVSDLSTQYPC